MTEDGKPRSTCANTTVAVRHMGIQCRKDLFHEKFLVDGEPINAWAGDMSDDVIQMIRKTIRYRYGFDPKVENTRDACTQLCLEHQFDPVCDYLDSLTWDGTPRLDNWLVRYMGAPDTELNRVIGRVTLIAAVRRAFDPGTKFDQIVVFESVEGRGKSTAIEIMAGADNFSDQHIMGLPGREQQEAMTGVWLYEIADLTGMKKADVEQVKAFASRKVDRARPAYGRFRVDRARRTLLFATTNDDDYLKSQTGNRRFWPVPTTRIDLDGLCRDRDQLWAEAAHCEARGDSILLPERLWKSAGEEQERRLEIDSWQDCIANYLGLTGKEDVTTNDVLVDNQFLRLDPAKLGRFEQMRAGNVLRNLGFERYKKWVGTHTQNRYRKKQQKSTSGS
jgi:predicted P-loop ATPase